MTNRRAWLALMFVTGFCSMIYELAMAQLLASIMGNVVGRFATTLGVYVFGLGLGSILFKSRDEERDARLFYRTELALFFVGFLSPFFFVYIHHLFGEHPNVVLIGTHLLVFVTGFLSGFELPILATLLDRRFGANSATALSADYIGMFAASLAFPLLLFPFMGLGAAFWAATLLNVAAAAATYYMIGGKSKFAILSLTALFVVNTSVLVSSDSLHRWLSEVYASLG